MEKSDMEAPLLLHEDSGADEGLGRTTAADSAYEDLGDWCTHQWMTRSIALVVVVCCILAIVVVSSSQDSRNSRLQNGAGGLVQRIAESEAEDGERLTFLGAQHTRFHFQPPKNFMSDPCAPMYYKGYYHLWYQWNPYDRVWGNMTWGHTVSTDLVHWRYLDVSLEPDQWYDRQGAWSGYVTLVDGVPVVLYTGGRGLFGGDANQSISMARPVDPSDPFLREWKKVDANPLLLTPEGFSSQAFRDPTTAWLEDGDDLWRLSIPSVIENPDGTRDGIGLMYTSPDFYNWTLQDTLLHRVKGTGTWECIDLFPTIPESEVAKQGEARLPEVYHDGMKYVLKAGMDETRIDYYAIGTYSTETHQWTPDDPALDVGFGLRYDYGRFYASKTFYDITKNRRVLWGYVHELDSEDDDIKKGWACLQSLPRTVWLDPKTMRNVLQWPVEEIEALRGAHVSYKDIDLHPTDVLPVHGGDGQQLDILVAFEKPDLSVGEWDIEEEFNCSKGADKRSVFGPFGLIVLADNNRNEHSDIFFYIARKPDGEWGTMVCSDQSRSSLYDDLNKTAYGNYVEVVESDEALTLRVLVDHSIVETYVQGGRFAITARVYPTLAIGSNAKVFLFNNATTPMKVKSLHVYQMGSVTMTAI